MDRDLKSALIASIGAIIVIIICLIALREDKPGIEIETTYNGEMYQELRDSNGDVVYLRRNYEKR